MIFIVSIETPGRGSYILGHINTSNKKIAQQEVFEKLVESGIPKHKIGLQVTDNSTIHVGLHVISIIPLPEFDGKFPALTAQNS